LPTHTIRAFEDKAFFVEFIGHYFCGLKFHFFDIIKNKLQLWRIKRM
jgi:hypothetical protein